MEESGDEPDAGPERQVPERLVERLVGDRRLGRRRPSVNAPQGAASRARFREALDLVVKRQEPLARQVEAVVGPQLAVGDEDEDPFLEIEQLENGQGVSLAV